MVEKETYKYLTLERLKGSKDVQQKSFDNTNDCSKSR